MAGPFSDPATAASRHLLGGTSGRSQVIVTTGPSCSWSTVSPIAGIVVLGPTGTARLHRVLDASRITSLIDLPSWPEAARRVPVVLAGLVCFGVGIALMVRADLGLAPWDVFHQGVADRTGLPLGTVVIVTGLVLLAAFVPLRERIGLGTVLNAVVIGLVVDATMAVVEAPEAMGWRVLCMAAGPPIIAVGSGLYLGGGLGAGPRDGLMTGIARRGHAIWRVRTGIELSALFVGLLLGGSVGVGTLWFALGIGPLVQAVLPLLTFLPERPPRERPIDVVQPAPGS